MKIILFSIILAAAGLLFVSHAHAMAPLAPPIVSINVASSTEIDLSWGAVVADPAVTGYNVEREVGGGFTQIAANLNATSYADTNLTPGTAYSYRVTAINSDGLGPTSQIMSAGTYTQQLPIAPTPPQNLKAVAVSGSEVDLSWVPPVQSVAPVTGYVVEREIGIGDGFTRIVADTGSAGTTYADTNLSQGATYDYRVSATNMYGTGFPSNSAAATTYALPVAPTNISVSSGDAMANLSWTAPFASVGITNYIISSNQTTSTISVPATSTSVAVGGLTNGTSYIFSVSAVNPAGQGPAAQGNAVTPRAGAVASPAPQYGAPPASSGAATAASQPAPTKFIFTSSLYKGLQSQAVTELQNILIVKGFLKASATGYFGSLTQAAVKAYQGAHGISQTGTVGPLTRAYLNGGL